MIKGILNYFSSLNTAGQALFVVGVLLIITFIVLLIIVLNLILILKKKYCFQRLFLQNGPDEKAQNL